MLVFIDDSGDAGFKLGEGSSRYFIIVCVIFDDALEAERVALAIKDLKRELKFSDLAEFKFNKSKKIVRERFLETICRFRFRVRSIVIDKTLLRSPILKTEKRSFYSFAIKMVLQHNKGKIKNARIKIDGSGDRIFRKNFLSYLRRELNSRDSKIIKDCKLVDSRGNVLIQMADMIAGSIHRSREDGKKDKSLYKTMLKKHIEDEWNFK